MTTRPATRYSQRPPRTTRPRTPRQRPTDRAVALRRLFAVGVALMLVVLVVLGLKGCLDSRERSAIRTYAVDASKLVDASNRADRRFFSLLKGSSGSALTLQAQVNGLRADTEKSLQRARSLNPPGELDAANEALIDVLGLRAAALRAIATDIPGAFSEKEREDIFRGIAAEMRLFVASDVIFEKRYLPNLTRVLRESELRDRVPIPRSRSLEDPSWLVPQTVAKRLGAERQTGGAASGEPAPPNVSIASVTVEPSGATLGQGATAIAPSSDMAFEVTVRNAGEEYEGELTVALEIADVEPIRAEKNVIAPSPGQNATVTLPLESVPPSNAVPLTVSVTVPGQEKPLAKSQFLINFQTS